MTPKQVNKRLITALYHPDNFSMVEALFLEELELQRQAKGVTYDFTKVTKDDLLKYLKPAFQDILGLQMPENGILLGNLGKLEAILLNLPEIFKNTREDFAREMAQYRDSIDETQSLLLGNLPITLTIGKVFQRVKDLGSSYNYKTGKTFISETSWHEGIIDQAHESYHKLFLTQTDEKSVRRNNSISEGGARDFQVRANDYLASATGDTRFRFACRWR